MVYIVFPTDTEMSPLRRRLDGASQVMLGRRPGLAGTLAGCPVTAIVSGMGQANAAQAVAAISEAGRPELIVLAGCAGAYPGSGLKTGDVAVATEEVYADLGIETASGFMDIAEVGIPLVVKDGREYFGRYPMAGGFRPWFEEASGSVRFGRFLTVSAISGSSARGRALHERYGGICENMEGAAAAQVALIYGAPLIEVRGISNMVEDRDRSNWDVGAASEKAVELVCGMLGIWKRKN